MRQNIYNAEQSRVKDLFKVHTSQELRIETISSVLRAEGSNQSETMSLQQKLQQTSSVGGSFKEIISAFLHTAEELRNISEQNTVWLTWINHGPVFAADSVFDHTGPKLADSSFTSTYKFVKSGSAN